MLNNIFLLVLYLKNTKEYLLSLLLANHPNLHSVSFLPRIIWFFLFLFIQISIFFLLVPEKLKYPSYIGCVILVLCFVSFWANNLLIPPHKNLDMKPAIWGNAFSFFSNSLTSFESAHGFFPIRSTMKNRGRFKSVLSSSFVVATVVMFLQGFSFYWVDWLEIPGSALALLRLLSRAQLLDQRTRTRLLFANPSKLFDRGHLRFASIGRNRTHQSIAPREKQSPVDDEA